MHKSSKLEQIFAACFAQQWRTQLIGGAAEPVYLPAESAADHHLLIYTRDYFASALHEVAHWCIAGPRRRLLVDYGYWYEPDGRTAAQQRVFEQVEVLPQAIEWLFARACGFRFQISADNITAGRQASEQFKMAVAAKAGALHKTGLTGRAAEFEKALRRSFGQTAVVANDSFDLGVFDPGAPDYC